MNDLKCCARCGRKTTDPDAIALFLYRTEDGFRCHWPTCGHGKYLLCPRCNADVLNVKCPQCGCLVEYT